MVAIKKKTYKRPEITRVKLNPEEAVLTACKTSRPGPGDIVWCSPRIKPLPFPNRDWWCDICGIEPIGCVNRQRGS